MDRKEKIGTLLKNLKGEKGDRGEDGVNGKDGAPGKNGLPGKDGRDGVDGRDGRDGVDGKDGRDGSPDTGEQIVEKIAATESIIPKKNLEGFTEFENFTRSNLARRAVTGGQTALNIKNSGANVGRVETINFTGATITPVGDGREITVAVTGGGGSGDVVGPASSTDNAIVRFDTTTGKLVQDSAVTISDTGEIAAGSGSAASPSYSFSADTDTGFYSAGANSMRLSVAGADRVGFVSTQMIIAPTVGLFFSASSASSSSNSPGLFYDNTSFTLAQRNSTNAQTFRVYGTWTDASNGDWLNITKTAGGTATISTAANGTGTAGALTLNSGTGTNLTINGASNIAFQTAGVQRGFLSTNTLSFTGLATSSSATSPRYVYICAADTALTASTDAVNVHFDLSTTRQHATGAITLQRDMVISGTTHSAVGASVITDIAALALVYGNVSTNVTATNLSGLYLPTRALTSGVTNGYGINIAAPSGATNNFAARFAGNIQFASGSLIDPALSVVTPSTTSVGYLGAPANAQSAAYGFVLTDAGKCIDHPDADTTARTFTIPANGSVAFPIGTIINIQNGNGAGVITLAITTDTLRWVDGSGTLQTGSRSIAANGTASIRKFDTTVWYITGTGIT